MYFVIRNFSDFGEKIRGAYTICGVTSPALCEAALGQHSEVKHITVYTAKRNIIHTKCH